MKKPQHCWGLRLPAISRNVVKWRGQDLNLRPRGYEPRELPGCSTPRQLSLSTSGVYRYAFRREVSYRRISAVRFDFRQNAGFCSKIPLRTGETLKRRKLSVFSPISVHCRISPWILLERVLALLTRKYVKMVVIPCCVLDRSLNDLPSTSKNDNIEPSCRGNVTIGIGLEFF